MNLEQLQENLVKGQMDDLFLRNDEGQLGIFNKYGIAVKYFNKKDTELLLVAIQNLLKFQRRIDGFNNNNGEIPTPRTKEKTDEKL